MKFTRVMTAVAFVFALTTAFAVGCGGSPSIPDDHASISGDGVALPFAEPVAGSGLGSSSLLLSGGSFGSSSYSTNYRCSSDMCSCNDDINGRGDCYRMIVEGACAGPLFCFPGEAHCLCRPFAPGGPNSGTGCPSGPGCMITSEQSKVVAEYGFYQIPGNSTVWKEQRHGDRACAVLGTQFTHLMASITPPTVETVTGDRATFLILSMTGQFCTDAESGDWNPDHAELNGLYRTSDGALRMLGDAIGQGPALRACQLSWHQYHDLLPNQANGADPAFTDLLDGTDRKGFFMRSYAGNVAPCLDMEMAAH